MDKLFNKEDMHSLYVDTNFRQTNAMLGNALIRTILIDALGHENKNTTDINEAVSRATSKEYLSDLARKHNLITLRTIQEVNQNLQEGENVTVNLAERSFVHVLEAHIGIHFNKYGYPATKEILMTLLTDLETSTRYDYKGQVISHCSREHLTYLFKHLQEEKGFLCQFYVDDLLQGEGRSSKKRIAEQLAAKVYLDSSVTKLPAVQDLVLPTTDDICDDNREMADNQECQDGVCINKESAKWGKETVDNTVVSIGQELTPESAAPAWTSNSERKGAIGTSRWRAVKGQSAQSRK